MELFDNINRYHESMRDKNKPVDLQFRTCSYDYLDNICKLINSNAPGILDVMNSNVDVLQGIFESNSNSDLLWCDIRFINLLIELFSSNKHEYTQLKLFMINNIDKLNLKLWDLLENSDNVDHRIKIEALIEILFSNIIAEIKSIESIDWSIVPDTEWYILMCSIYAQPSISNGSIGNPVAILNNFILNHIIGDSKNAIIDLYYIFFGKNFSKVALENIYPSCEDELDKYHSLKSVNITHMSDNNSILYKRSENVLKATREIIVSLTTPEIVKILRIIDSNRTLLRKTNPTMDIFLDEDPRIQNAIKVMHEYDY